MSEECQCYCPGAHAPISLQLERLANAPDPDPSVDDDPLALLAASDMHMGGNYYYELLSAAECTVVLIMSFSTLT